MPRSVPTTDLSISSLYHLSYCVWVSSISVDVFQLQVLWCFGPLSIYAEGCFQIELIPLSPSRSLSFLLGLSLQAEWVALNYVPFAERSLEVVVDQYQKTACHKAVINEKVLQNIIKVLSPTLPSRHIALFISVHVKGVARKLELFLVVVVELLPSVKCLHHSEYILYLLLEFIIILQSLVFQS